MRYNYDPREQMVFNNQANHVNEQEIEVEMIDEDKEEGKRPQFKE